MFPKSPCGTSGPGNQPFQLCQSDVQQFFYLAEGPYKSSPFFLRRQSEIRPLLLICRLPQETPILQADCGFLPLELVASASHILV